MITEGENGDRFYIVKEGEAVVYAGGKEVNRLFKADFFGEQALLKDEPRWGKGKGGVCIATRGGWGGSALHVVTGGAGGIIEEQRRIHACELRSRSSLVFIHR